jgi:hypothetical protein
MYIALSEQSGGVANSAATYAVSPGSTLGPQTGYLSVFRGFPQSHQARAGIIPKIWPLYFPFKSFPVHNSPITLAFDAIQSVLLKTLNKLQINKTHFFVSW